MLSDFGYTTILSESGLDALRLIASNPDSELVLADFAISEINRVDLAKAISNTRLVLRSRSPFWRFSFARTIMETRQNSLPVKWTICRHLPHPRDGEVESPFDVRARHVPSDCRSQNVAVNRM